MATLGRRPRGAFDYWPGFVDALSTLLIVIIFLVLVFVLAQFYLGQAISGRDAALKRLNDQVTQLADMLSMERAANADLRLNIGQLTSDLQSSAAARDAAVNRLSGIIAERDAITARLNEATAKLAQTQSDTGRAAKELEDANKVIAADKDKLDLQLKQLAQLESDITALQKVREDLEKQVAGMAQQLQAKDADLTAARDRSKELETRLSTAEERTALAQKDLAQRDIRLAELMARGETMQSELGQEQQVSKEAQTQVDLLNRQIAALREQLSRIQQALDISEAKTKEQDVQIVDLGRRLNAALASKVEELARYRSEFFGRLREVLAGNPDVRIVGDRFVFQSEVLFAQGSAELGDPGKQQILRLAALLKDLIPRIPPEINWVLRVDGHTDKVPIHTLQFASNWELSTARAIAVVKFLADQGIPPGRLAATGFGEFQPLDTRDDEISRRRNRRIELKLTER
jgi:chemotaxis protein MotB